MKTIYRRLPSPLGALLLAADGKALTGLWFADQPDCPAAPGEAFAACPVFDQTERWLEIYFAGRAPSFSPPLRLEGTPFRRAVWELLLRIPFGETVSYGALAALTAEKLGLPRMSARAVGGAVGHNPISIIVPCHRVVGADGSLTGYAGGTERKRYLLRLEREGRPVPSGAEPIDLQEEHK